MDTTTKGRILLCDDDDAMRAFLRRGLQRDGLDVVECKNGLELLDRFSTGPAFDLVVTDVRMPVLSGMEVLAMTTKQVRPPIVVITAFLDPSVLPLALQLGAAAVLSKPFELRELRMLVSTLLARTHAAAG